MNNKDTDSAIVSLKTVIRTKNFETSKSFYINILGLRIVEVYDDGNGSQGCILSFGQENSNAFLEISSIANYHDYYQEPFSEPFTNDKIDIQLRTSDINHWATLLKEKWEARGPVERPWGSKYLYLKDPDGLQIIIYQERKDNP